jgi:hypothetical protein
MPIRAMRYSRGLRRNVPHGEVRRVLPQPTLVENNGLYRTGGAFWGAAQKFGAITLFAASRGFPGVITRDTDICDSTYGRHPVQVRRRGPRHRPPPPGPGGRGVAGSRPLLLTVRDRHDGPGASAPVRRVDRVEGETQ